MIMFNLKRFIKNLSYVDNRIHKIIDNYKPRQRPNMETKKELQTF